MILYRYRAALGNIPSPLVPKQTLPMLWAYQSPCSSECQVCMPVNSNDAIILSHLCKFFLCPCLCVPCCLLSRQRLPSRADSIFKKNISESTEFREHHPCTWGVAAFHSTPEREGTPPSWPHWAACQPPTSYSTTLNTRSIR